MRIPPDTTALRNSVSPRETARPSSEDASEGRDERGSSRSLLRAIEILEYLLKRGEPATVTQLIGDLRIPKSTAYEIARTLTEGGFLSAPGRGGGLFLGRRLYDLGMAYRAEDDLLREGARIVEDLRDETGDTVQLSVLEDDMLLVLLKQEGIRPLRIISNAGSRVPVNWAAAGRLLVSDMDDAALTRLLKATVRQSPTGQAETDIARIIAQIRRFRRLGHAIELNEANEHAGCVAAPVIDKSGKVIAALSIAAPEQRLTRAGRAALVAAVVRAAEELARRLA
jgi:DNA-binding IclR family transcriptional regulator